MRGRKYGNQFTRLSGRNFASRAEGSLYQYLKLREAAGEISNIREQRSVYLTDAEILYKPDFSAVDTKTGEEFFAEFKGFETALWRLKRRLWMYYGPAKLEVWKGFHKRIYLDEVLEPKKK